MELTTIVAAAAACTLVAGWLFVSFSEPSPRREIIEWVSATALYVVLLSLFVRFALRARADDSTAVFGLFVALIVFFGGGLVMSTINTLQSIRGGQKSTDSATN